MPNNISTRDVVLACVVIVACVVAFVILTLNGYGTDAAALPLVIGGLVPVLIRQSAIQATADSMHDKVSSALNGGLEKAIVATLTRMAARDQVNGTTVVQDAVTNLTTDVTPVAPAVAASTAPAAAFPSDAPPQP